MDIGTGIVVGSAILGTVAVAFKIFNGTKRKKNNPNGKYLLEKVFDEYKEGTNAQLVTLTKTTSDIKESMKRVHGRIDKVLEKI